jgi:hypothetical protein
MTGAGNIEVEAARAVDDALKECRLHPIDFFNNGGDVEEIGYARAIRISE